MAISNQIDRLFRRNILAVTSDLSQRTKVVAVIHTETDCPNCIWDAINKTSSGKYNGTGAEAFTGNVCPVCHGKGRVNNTVNRRLPGANFRFGGNATDPRYTAHGYLPEDEAKLKINAKFRRTLEQAEHFIVSGTGYSLRYRRKGEVRNRGLLTEVISEINLVRET